MCCDMTTGLSCFFCAGCMTLYWPVWRECRQVAEGEVRGTRRRGRVGREAAGLGEVRGARRQGKVRGARRGGWARGEVRGERRQGEHVARVVVDALSACHGLD